jgi:hypothetical protein
VNNPGELWVIFHKPVTPTTKTVNLEVGVRDLFEIWRLEFEVFIG